MRKEIYPEIEPFKTRMLDVSDKHSIYYEQCGNPNGRPVVFLHGGPGVGSVPKYRQFFDPEFYHIIIFDQRGAGQSNPLGSLEDNNTDELVKDIEKLREHLNIDKWVVFGGSWGSTLSLVYAIRHPDKVIALSIRGIFLGRQKDIDWLFEDGAAGQIFPDYFEEYKNYIPENERNNLVNAYYKRLTNNDENIVLEAGKRFSIWENKISKLVYQDEENLDFSTRDLACSRIEAHYMINKCFFEEGYILNNLDKIIHIPTFIVHGRYDIVCSSSNAWDLYKKWLELSDYKYKPKLVITPSSGHSQMETENFAELVGFMEEIKNI